MTKNEKIGREVEEILNRGENIGWVWSTSQCKLVLYNEDVLEKAYEILLPIYKLTIPGCRQQPITGPLQINKLGPHIKIDNCEYAIVFSTPSGAEPFFFNLNWLISGSNSTDLDDIVESIKAKEIEEKEKRVDELMAELGRELEELERLKNA